MEQRNVTFREVVVERVDADRKEVSERRLVEILNEELAKHEETQGCNFMGTPQRMPEPYPDQGNWLRSLAIKGAPADPHACGLKAAEIISEVAAVYNLR